MKRETAPEPGHTLSKSDTWGLRPSPAGSERKEGGRRRKGGRKMVSTELHKSQSHWSQSTLPRRLHLLLQLRMQILLASCSSADSLCGFLKTSVLGGLTSSSLPSAPPRLSPWAVAAAGSRLCSGSFRGYPVGPLVFTSFHPYPLLTATMCAPCHPAYARQCPASFPSLFNLK